MTGTYPDIEIIGILGATEGALGALDFSSIAPNLTILEVDDPETIDIPPDASIDKVLTAISIAYGILNKVNAWAGDQVEKGVSVN